MKQQLRFFIVLTGLMYVATGSITAQTGSDLFRGIGFERYYDRTEFLMASPGALKYGLYGYDNPALLHYLHQPDFAFHWTSSAVFRDSQRMGAFLGLPGSSFSFVNNELFGQTYRDYRISLGGGTDAAAAGIAFNWYRGNKDIFDLKSNVTIGTITRPVKYISIGLTGTSTFDFNYYETVADIAVRPAGTPILTLFGDYALDERTDNFLDGRWSAGAVVEAISGLRLTGRFIDSFGFTAGVQVSFGRSGLSYQAHRDRDGNHRYNSWSVRAGAMDRNISDNFFMKNRNYVEVDIQGEMPYQKFIYFDQRPTFLAIIDQLHESARDPSVAGVLINTNRMQIDRTKLWETRQSLKEIQAAGKKVVVYIERGGMNTLHLASVADYVVMDPQGSMILPGYASGMTYLADLLSTVGIGVDEFREMEYKSAFEVLSRTGMSDADREQRQVLIDNLYELVKSDVSEGRGITGEAYDALIDRGISLSSRDLVEAGIVDTLARFAEMDDIIKKLEGSVKKQISPENLPVYHRPDDDRWGPKYKIAVLYAEGPTMNESGIRARKLSDAVRNARNDRNVKAVVLRADSPGGDALAADLVAEELRKTAEVKPVIVSMGSVAASGGYWISMYADTIVAAPNTITGSIGVIGGWLWNDGIAEHLHLTTDKVSRGASADLLIGPTLPLIGLGLPDRPLTVQEREGVIKMINNLYDDFIVKVAAGRDLENYEVRNLAEGRVWSGTDAQKNGLVDELGNLYTAIEIAKEMAGLTPEDKVSITEGPEPPHLSFSLLMDRIFAMDNAKITRTEPVKEYLELMIENNATPLIIMPFEYFSWMYYLRNNH